MEVGTRTYEDQRRFSYEALDRGYYSSPYKVLYYLFFYTHEAQNSMK